MSLYIGFPQALMLLFALLTMTATAILHGKPREGNYHTGYTLALWFILIPLMLWGGFFTK